MSVEWRHGNKNAAPGVWHLGDVASIWAMNWGGKTVWRIWIYELEPNAPLFMPSEAAAKAYVEAVLPFAPLHSLK